MIFLTNSFLQFNSGSNLVKQIASVTAEDIARVAPKYIPSLFKSDNSRVTVVVHTSKATEVASGFKE